MERKLPFVPLLPSDLQTHDAPFGAEDADASAGAEKLRRRREPRGTGLMHARRGRERKVRVRD